MSRSNQQTAQKTVNAGFGAGLLFMTKTVLISYGISLALLFIVSVIATFKTCSDYTISVMVNIVTAFGVSFCGFAAGQHFESKGIVYGAICGSLYSIVLFFIGVMVTGSFQFTNDSLTVLAIGFICGAVGGIVGINTKRHERR